MGINAIILSVNEYSALGGTSGYTVLLIMSKVKTKVVPFPVPIYIASSIIKGKVNFATYGCFLVIWICALFLSIIEYPKFFNIKTYKNYLLISAL